MNERQTTQREIGVTVQKWGATLDGILLSVNWDTRRARIETWRDTGNGRYSWLEAEYDLDAVTLAPEVKRPCEIYDSFDLARMRDDGSEAEAQHERTRDLEFRLNGYF